MADETATPTMPSPAGEMRELMNWNGCSTSMTNYAARVKALAIELVALAAGRMPQRHTLLAGVATASVADLDRDLESDQDSGPGIKDKDCRAEGTAKAC